MFKIKIAFRYITTDNDITYCARTWRMTDNTCVRFAINSSEQQQDV